MFPVYLRAYQSYLMLEKNVSQNTVDAYSRDITLLQQFCEQQTNPIDITTINVDLLRQFITTLSDLELSNNSQARIVSGIKSFFNFLELEQIIINSPSILLEAPKTNRKLPDTLSVEEISQLFHGIEHTKAEGLRNRALLETMYSSGLRVSEVTQLLISNLYLDIGYIRVLGKGNKERLIPIGDSAIEHIQYYLNHDRLVIKHTKKGHEDILFLNRRGAALSRVMVFYIIKDASLRAGIDKNIHPHTLRHCFATHLIEGGANLRAVQEMMGHVSITTTEIYTHLDTGFLRKTLEQYHPRY